MATNLLRTVLTTMLLGCLLSGTAAASDTVYYYSSDTLRSEVVITDASRNVVERTYYAPYGQVLNRQMRDGPGYTGHEEDPESSLVYMQQRYYDPQSGRFLSNDPVATTENGESFDRYAYANDNPYRYTDPTGEDGVDGGGTATQQSGGCAAVACPVVQAAAYVDAQNAQLQATLASPFSVNLPVPGLIGVYGTYHAGARQGNFTCGSYKCSYQMGPFSTPDGQTGAWIAFSVSGLGDGDWVQTWSDSTGQSGPDCLAADCPFYPSYASTGQWFIDDPARPSQNVTWVGQTSYVLPYAAGAAFTIQWGYTMSNGVLSYIVPALATPWAGQQLQISSAHLGWNP